MYIYVAVLMSSIVILFIVSGVLIKHKRYYWLISGHTMPEGQQVKSDTTALGNFIGNFCFVIAGILLLAGVFDHFHINYGFVLSIASLFFVVAFMLIRAQKYDHNILNAGKKKTVPKIILGIIVATLVIVGGMLIYGSIEQSVDVDKGKIEIGGLYGTTLDVSDIKGVFLIKELPKIQSKTTGFDFANILKGDFKLDGIGDGKLFVNTGSPLFINIKYKDSFVILNFKDSIATRKLYNEISKLGKVE